MPLPRTIAVVALLAAAGLAGCGTSTDRHQARVAAERLYSAAQAGDGAEACAQMSPDLRVAVVQDKSASSCAAAVARLHLQRGSATSVRVYADAAQVRFAGGETVFLGDTREGWRVDAFACHPAASGLYDCGEES